MRITPIFSRLRTVIVVLLRETVAMIIRWTGIPLVIRRTIGRRRATIIVYHDPSPQILERHLGYLANRYTFVSLSRMVDALRENRWQSMPDQALVVTIDDGHKGNAHLIPIFEKYGVLPTVFACSHLVGTCRHFWWTHADTMAEIMKKLPHDEALDLLENATGYSLEREYGTPAAVNEVELRSLSSCGEIGSHTCHHPILVNCDDETCWREITESKRKLEEHLDSEIFHFSYPNGDYSRRERTMMADAGYLSARTLDVGWVGRASEPYRLKAMCVEDDASINVLSAQVAGLFQYLHYVLRGSWNGRRPWGLP